MSILHVPVTASNLAEWVRRAAGAINQLITGKQDKSDNLTSLSDLDLTGHSGDAVVVTAGEDGFELSAVSGGSGIADGDYGDVTVSSSGTVISIDAGVVSTTELGGDITTAGKAILDDSTAGDQLTTLGLSANGKSLVTAADYAAMKALLDLEIGTDVQAYNALLAAIVGLGSNGLVARTAAGTAAARTITAGNTGTTVSNGGGVGGNPTITSGVWALAGTGQTATGVWDFAVDGAKTNVDFAGLSSFNELLIILDAVTGSAATANRTIRVSTDNGSTFYSTSGDYVQLSAAGTVTNTGSCGFLSGATASAATTMTQIRNMKGAVKAIVSLSPGNFLFRASSSDINAVRITSNSADTLNGGKIYVYAR